MTKPKRDDLAEPPAPEPVTALAAESPSEQTGSPHQCQRLAGVALAEQKHLYLGKR